MIKVAEIVEELLVNDEIALEAFRANLLNLSAYAKKIQPQIEKITYKNVQLGTIVVALSRISKNNTLDQPALKPDLQLTDIGIKSSLSAIVFDKTADIQRKIAVLHPFQISLDDLFSVTEGVTEITLICTEKSKLKILTHFATEPKFIFDDLIAVTVQYTKEFAAVPNIYHVLVSALAHKRINIIEIIANYTEMTFILKKENMEESLKALNSFFVKTTKSG